MKTSIKPISASNMDGTYEGTLEGYVFRAEFALVGAAKYPCSPIEVDPGHRAGAHHGQGHRRRAGDPVSLPGRPWPFAAMWGDIATAMRAVGWSARCADQARRA